MAQTSNYMKHADIVEDELEHVDTLRRQNDLLLVMTGYYYRAAFGAMINMYVQLSLIIIAKQMPILLNDDELG